MSLTVFARRYQSWLKTFPKHADVIELHRMERLLELLGHPEHDIPGRIQIVGTNGKGSTTALMGSILKESGYKVGIFSSPSFVTESEQIRLGTEFLPDELFEEQLHLLEPHVEQIQQEMGETLTRFELTTALAVLLFRYWNVDVALFEAGLGGAYDSTSTLQCQVIAFTNVSIDHINVLGDTVHEIASDKIQAVREGTKAVATTFEGEARGLLEDRCWDQGVSLTSPVQVFSDDLSFSGTRCQIQTPQRTYNDLHVRLIGLHQAFNASLAITTLEEAARVFDLGISKEDVRRGCEQVVFPGRFQIVSSTDFREPLPQPPQIILDGAHNRAGTRSILRSLSSLEATPPVAVFATKNFYVDSLRDMAEQCAHVYLPRITFAPHFKEPGHLAQFVRPELRKKLTITETLEEALFLGARQGEEEVRPLLISGSLYFLGALFAAEPGLLPAAYKEAPLPTLSSPLPLIVSQPAP